MAPPKRQSAQRPAPRSHAPHSGAPAPKALPGQIAVRYRAGDAQTVRNALAPYGRLEAHPPQRLVILHRAAGVPGATVRTALGRLQDSGVVEFTTPVLRNPDSNTRQVLTDEIVVRLKRGHARQALAAIKSEHGLLVARRNEFEPTQYIVKVPRPSGLHTLDVARSIDRRADVEFASPNFLTDIKR